MVVPSLSTARHLAPPAPAPLSPVCLVLGIGPASPLRLLSLRPLLLAPLVYTPVIV